VRNVTLNPSPARTRAGRIAGAISEQRLAAGRGNTRAPVEGKVCKIRFLTRLMFGRASYDLLRKMALLN
jgi:transposase